MNVVKIATAGGMALRYLNNAFFHKAHFFKCLSRTFVSPSLAVQCTATRNAPEKATNGYQGSGLSEKVAETQPRAGSAPIEEFEARIKEVEAKFQEENATLAHKCKELEDKYKRALAESENIRQRLQKQINDAKVFGIQSFCKDLLEVADVLKKAAESVPRDQLQKNVQLQSLFDGLTMTETNLKQVFSRHGLYQINPAEGDLFDPNVHEAMFQQPVTNNQKSGTIALVTKTGYRLHDRTVRPALVGVYK